MPSTNLQGHLFNHCPACAKGPSFMSVPFGEWIERAEQYHRNQSSEAHAYDFGRKLIYIGQRFATTPAELMSRAVIQEWLDETAEEYEWGAASYNRYHSCFSSIFQIANIDNDDFFNPMTKIPRKKERGKERYWSEAEDEAIISATRRRFPGYEDIFILAEEVGYRKSEQLRAQVGDYSSSSHKIAVHQRKNSNAGPIRYVPLSDRGIESYLRLCAGRSVGQPLLVLRDLQYKNGTRRVNEPMKDIRSWFDNVLDDAGITDSAASWHVCRHTFCSRLCAKGVPVTDVKIYAGHTDIRTTMRYTHAIEGENDLRARAAMNAKKGPAAPTMADLQASISGLASAIAKLQPGQFVEAA